MFFFSKEKNILLTKCNSLEMQNKDLSEKLK